MDTDTGKDFFISYTSADTKWAEWIAWQLEEAQYSTILQAWDFQPGMNFVLEMDKAAQVARCTIVVLSPAYLSARYTQPEWAVAFRHDPKSEKGALLPVRVQKCEVEGLLGSIVSIDLVDLDAATAHKALLDGVQHKRIKPATAPDFPGERQHTIPEPRRFPGALPPIWNIPFPRNPYFTGRENILKNLYDAFRTGKTAATAQPQAISGLGGVGKTQIAVEYAYRYSNDYQVGLWVRADTHQLLISDFVVVAGLLNLPEKDVQDQNKAVEAIKRWLKEHREWLLISDNADDLAMVRQFIPLAFGGHILLTTRAQAMGRLAHRIEIEKMEPEEGALFLLRRASIIEESDSLDQASEAERNKAKVVSQEMDGLPLALDQAGHISRKQLVVWLTTSISTRSMAPRSGRDVVDSSPTILNLLPPPGHFPSGRSNCSILPLPNYCACVPSSHRMPSLRKSLPRARLISALSFSLLLLIHSS